MIFFLEYFNYFEEVIKEEFLVYLYDKCQIYYFNYFVGVNDLSIYLMFYIDKLLFYFVFGMIDNDAFDGLVLKNFFNF